MYNYINIIKKNDPVIYGVSSFTFIHFKTIIYNHKIYQLKYYVYEKLMITKSI